MSILDAYVNLISSILWKMKINFGAFSVELKPDAQKGSIDERIAKIDQARDNFLEGIEAIDELRSEAEQSKEELERMVMQIATLKNDKEAMEGKKKEIEKAAKIDMETLREIVGVRRERTVSFISGVIASMIATGVIYIAVLFFKRLS